MQKTIRLDGNEYQLNDGGEVRVFVDVGQDEPDYILKLSKYKIGAEATLGSVTDVSPNAIRAGTDKPRFFLDWHAEGIAGNSNHNIRRTTGWRGTTDDRSIDAHGRVRISSIRSLKSGDIAVTVKSIGDA